MKHPSCLAWLVLLLATAIAPAASELWFNQPADKLAKTQLKSWEHENPNYTNKGNVDKAWHDYVLPIGNGFMGAGIFGGVALERVQLNEQPPFPRPPIRPDGWLSGHPSEANY